MAIVMQEGMAPGILEQMSDARATCRELLQLLVAENASLNKSSVTEVEARLQNKRRLTLRLEVLLKDLKARRQEWTSRKDAQEVALRLAEEVSVFQDMARKNMELLRAAHQLRADMVSMIRDTLEAQAPRVQTYGRYGSMTPSGNAPAPGGARMMARDV